jgi:hypothetical protein
MQLQENHLSRKLGLTAGTPVTWENRHFARLPFLLLATTACTLAPSCTQNHGSTFDRHQDPAKFEHRFSLSCMPMKAEVLVAHTLLIKCAEDLELLQADLQHT